MGTATSLTSTPAATKSYDNLRLYLGLIGFLLPILLIFGHMILVRDWVFLGSISVYYYTDVGDIFVGTFFTIGIFLIAYVGYEQKNPRLWENDDIIGNIGGLCAIATALLPTKEFGSDPTKWYNPLHLVFAGGLLAVFSIYCFILFKRTDQPTVGGNKKTRNLIYTICGGLIVISLITIIAIGGAGHLGVDISWFDEWKYTLVFESLATFAFSFAWLVKSQRVNIWKITLWQDPQNPSTRSALS